MKKLFLVMAVLALLSVGSTAYSYVWDTSATSYTYQNWEFSNGTRNPSPNAGAINGFGAATFSMSGGTWFASAATYTARTGLWAGAGSGTVNTAIVVPTSIAAVNDKLIRLQMIIGCTYLDGISGYSNGTIPGITLSGFGPGVASIESESLTALAGETYGYLYEKTWRVTNSNNTAETINGNIVYAGRSWSDIVCFDEMTVESIHTAQATTAVPEPMSIFLGLMGLSSIAGFRRLRKK